MVIYKTTNLVNGKIYIGLDTKNDPMYLGSGKLLHRSIKKHGIQNFKKDILESCQSIDELKNREVFWINFYNSSNLSIGYNITKGGSGGDTITNHPDYDGIIIKLKNRKQHSFSVETRRKLSESNKGKAKSEDHKKKISDSLTGRKISEETRNKLSASHIGLMIGEKNPMFGKPAWNSGKQMSDEFKSKLIGPREKMSGRNNSRYIELTDGQKTIILENYLKISKEKIRKILAEKTGLKIGKETLDRKIKELNL